MVYRDMKGYAATDRPRAVRANDSGSRYIAAAVRRTVWRRDNGRCAFVGSHGRCTATAFLEFHHKVPFATGGESTVENVELRCARTISGRRSCISARNCR